MKTKYFCPRCRETFEENKLPNMHKRHRCGSYVKILAHEADGPVTELPD